MPDGTGVDYGPEETVDLDYPEITGTILYAKWIEPAGHYAPVSSGDGAYLFFWRDEPTTPYFLVG